MSTIKDMWVKCNDTTKFKVLEGCIHKDQAPWYTFIAQTKQINELLRRNKDNTCRWSVEYNAYGRLNDASNYREHKIIREKLGDTGYEKVLCVFKDFRIDTPRGDYVFFINEINDTENQEYTDFATIIQSNYKDIIYNRINETSSVPVLYEWMDYIIKQLCNNNKVFFAEPFSRNGIAKHTSLVVDIDGLLLRDIIETGLRNGSINIANSETSDFMSQENVKLDEYMIKNNKNFTKIIQEKSRPRFTPGVDEYSKTLNSLIDYNDYIGDIKPYQAQKDVIQAISNTFDYKKNVFLVGEMGSGKTLISMDAVFTHNADKKAMTNIVMCPGHLVEKWKREIETRLPMSCAIIIDSQETLFENLDIIRDENRNKHIWLVISKDVAKNTYNERPAMIHSKRKQCYMCPKCGRIVQSDKRDGLFIPNKNKNNEKCYQCNTKLWTILNENDVKNNWVKFKGSTGWILKENIEKAYNIALDLADGNNMEPILECAKKKYCKALPELTDAMDGILPQVRAPYKYAISKIIKHVLKNKIDYAIFDEAHQLKAKDSMQADSFDDLIKTAKHSLLLTGTLLNGYASGLYYLLWRAYPQTMVKQGFTFDGVQDFIDRYGIMQAKRNYRRRLSKKELPGVSPELFTDFLVENAVYINQDDMAENLPGYTEIPVPVPMDSETKEAYNNITERLKECLSNNIVKRGQVMTQVTRLLSVYPDQPFDQSPILNTDKSEIAIEPAELSKEELRNKELYLINLIKEKKEAGEKVLVYYSWAGITDLGTRLPEILAQQGIKAKTMTASVKSSKREQWIKKELEDGLDVLICNPTLVETGLDLLDFTTIVFYQVGYNLYTTRQASRRSWRLSQTKDVEVYFLYYEDTVQETLLSIMATKLEAAMAVEGKFSEEGLNAMSNNDDVLTQLASAITEDIEKKVNIQFFEKASNPRTALTQEERAEKLINRPREFKFNTIASDYVKNRKVKKVINNNIFANLSSDQIISIA